MPVAKPVLKLYNGREGKPGLMTPDELCAYLGVEKPWIYQQTHAKKIPHLKVCGLLRFRKEEIDAWLESQEVINASNKKAKQKGRRLVY